MSKSISKNHAQANGGQSINFPGQQPGALSNALAPSFNAQSSKNFKSPPPVGAPSKNFIEADRVARAADCPQNSQTHRVIRGKR